METYNFAKISVTRFLLKIPLASSFFRINVLVIDSNDSDNSHKSAGAKIKKRFWK